MTDADKIAERLAREALKSIWTDPSQYDIPCGHARDRLLDAGLREAVERLELMRHGGCHHCNAMDLANAALSALKGDTDE